MPPRLPPLTSLRLFEAAARHLSFKAAAEETGVTASAVSHAVAALEDHLSRPLFRRGHRTLALTPAGLAYAERVAAALAILLDAEVDLPQAPAATAIRLSVAPTFAARWLMPRLADFHRQRPDIALSLDTLRQPVAFPRDGADLAIRIGDGSPPDLHGRRLFREWLVPVAAPALAAAVTSFDALCRQTPIRVTTVSEDWAVWCRLKGLPARDLPPGIRFDSLQLAAEAAAAGFGIALARLPLMAEEVACGRLVPVLGPPVALASAHHLIGRPDSLRRPEIRAFKTWLLAEIGRWSASVAGVLPGDAASVPPQPD